VQWDRQLWAIFASNGQRGNLRTVADAGKHLNSSAIWRKPVVNVGVELRHFGIFLKGLAEWLGCESGPRGCEVHAHPVGAGGDLVAAGVGAAGELDVTRCGIDVGEDRLRTGLEGG
jgi:hypothetical protein